jgi:hypothetical protein
VHRALAGEGADDGSQSREDTEDVIAEQRWLDEGGSFSRYPNQAEEIDDDRRTPDRPPEAP